MGRVGARHSRRWITRIAVGGLPTEVPPAGAGLTRGPRMPPGLVTPSRRAPPRGGASSQRRGKPAARRGQGRPSEAGDGVPAPCVTRAPSKPASARAMAPTTGVAGVPRALPRRSRVHRRRCACPRRSGRGGGRLARRRGQWRRTWAGSREAQAPSTTARWAGVWPVVVSAPCRRRSPRAGAEGSRPSEVSPGRGCATRGHAGHGHGAWPPRRPSRAATTAGRRQALPGARRACATRWRRAVGSWTART